MTASELIEELQKLIEIHGDYNVVVDRDDYVDVINVHAYHFGGLQVPPIFVIT